MQESTPDHESGLLEMAKAVKMTGEKPEERGPRIELQIPAESYARRRWKRSWRMEKNQTQVLYYYSPVGLGLLICDFLTSVTAF